MLDKARKILAKGISQYFVKKIILRNGIGADGAASAFLAKISEVELIDPFHHRVEMSGVIGEKSGLKVAFVGGFCAKSCARVNGVLGCEYFYNRVTFTNHKINVKSQNEACKIESDEVVKWRK
jgi:hypothetical protein